MMTMNEAQIRLLAKYIVEYAREDNKLLEKVAKMVERQRSKQKRLVSAKVAATMLGISIGTLYRLKKYPDGRPIFSCIKSGTSKSSTLKYNAATILEEYEEYLAWRWGSESPRRTRPKK